ncbi:MAG: hypothetical protein U5K81_15840 [Trueperaceae bacterium]|nr:hypothetical protein [Trueperaceae bacterium]
MTKPKKRVRVLLLAVLLAVGLSGCQQTPPGDGNGNGGGSCSGGSTTNLADDTSEARVNAQDYHHLSMLKQLNAGDHVGLCVVPGTVHVMSDGCCVDPRSVPVAGSTAAWGRPPCGARHGCTLAR